MLKLRPSPTDHDATKNDGLNDNADNTLGLDVCLMLHLVAMQGNLRPTIQFGCVSVVTQTNCYTTTECVFATRVNLIIVHNHNLISLSVHLKLHMPFPQSYQERLMHNAHCVLTEVTE